MAARSSSSSIKSLHRNVSPTWFGVVLAKHMQDPSITSELKALIAVVSTFPRESWTWRGDHLRSLLNWGRERYQKVMREAKARGFVTVHKTSDGRSLQAEYQWSIDGPQRAENPKGGKPDQRKTQPLNDRVKTKQEVKSNDLEQNKDLNRESFRTERELTATFQTFPQNEAQQGKTIIPPDSWNRLTTYLRTLPMELREPQRDSAALRALAEICPDENEIMDALSDASSAYDDADKVFGMAWGILKYREECESIRRVNVAWPRPPASVPMLTETERGLAW
ncbi:MAG TPA: hypothetical protein VNY51_09350 [Candidatus Dormibacteraeota bacterium]|jgi:hypothetical protein|nr:hypothetical protein [Candidatus Dormibacteraeota bacterium]